jgi:hypothetical protein
MPLYLCAIVRVLSIHCGFMLFLSPVALLFSSCCGRTAHTHDACLPACFAGAVSDTRLLTSFHFAGAAIISAKSEAT